MVYINTTFSNPREGDDEWVHKMISEWHQQSGPRHRMILKVLWFQVTVNIATGLT